MSDIPLNPTTPAQLRKLAWEVKKKEDSLQAELDALEAIAVTADAPFGADNVLVQTDGLLRKADATSILTADVVTASSAFAATGKLIESGTTGKGVAVTTINTADVVVAAGIANMVTAASNFGAADQLIVSSGTAKAAQSVAIVSADLVTAASAFGTDNQIIRSDGTGKGVDASVASITDDGHVSLVRGTGTHNLSIGVGALAAITGSSVEHTAIGDNALAAVTGTSEGNLAIGYRAGEAISSGSANFCLGRNAGRVITTANGNVAVGSGALILATTGGGNMAIGTAALNKVATGTNNIGIGDSAGNALTLAAAGNVFIGGSSGAAFAGQLVSAVNSIGLGIATATTANNQVVIGGSGNTNGPNQTVLRGTVDIIGRVATVGQTLNIYNTTDSTTLPVANNTYERLACSWQSNVARIETQKGSTAGTARDLVLGTDATERMRFGASGRATMSTLFNLGTTTELTIAAGVITVTKSYHRVDTEANAASDDLDTINGGSEGDLLVLRAEDSTHTVVVKDGTGNIECAGDFSMDNAFDRITLLFSGGSWVELCRSDNGA